MTDPDRIVAMALASSWRSNPVEQQIYKARQVLDALRADGWILTRSPTSADGVEEISELRSRLQAFRPRSLGRDTPTSQSAASARPGAPAQGPKAPRTHQTEEEAMNNLYRPHPLLIDSGTFWRCAHGTTGYTTAWDAYGRSGDRWAGCWRCALRAPAVYLHWKIRSILR